MAGLLDYASSIAGEAKNYASSVADEAKKNVQGLLADPKQQLMKILNNLTARAAASQAKTKAAWATRDPDIIAQDALDGLQTALSFAPLGITAWHGSPHKFNKFSMDKIGTGEGAQAYGHGLYLAENPKTAQMYADNLAIDPRDAINNIIKAIPDNPSADDVFFEMQRHQPMLSNFLNDSAVKRDIISAKIGQQADGTVTNDAMSAYKRLDKLLPPPDKSIYKTDIPDEAVARMLDWDKPLSQQSKEVQAALQRAADIRAKQTGGSFGPLDMGQAGREVVPSLGESRLRQAGIPGIRYLDGGSRGAGQGSSNFVVFDPEMIRILERNGQATGAVPWQPGEWRGLLGNN